MYYVCVCEGQKRVWKEGKRIWDSSYPFGEKSEGKSFYSIYMHVVWIFQHILAVIFKKKKIVKG